MRNKAHRVLLIDDDADERVLTAHALKTALPAGSTVFLTESGNDAIRYMIGEGCFSDRRCYPFPTLVITDLNMTGGDGFDVLEFLQANPAWSVVPRIMFTSSAEDDDVRTAFALGVSAYHVKPVGAHKLRECLQSILEYWASCEVPPIDASGRLLITVRGRRGGRYPQAKGAAVMRRPKLPGAPADADAETHATRLI